MLATSMRADRRRLTAKLGWGVALAALCAGAVLPDHLRTVVCRFGGAMDADSCCARAAAGRAVEVPVRLEAESCCRITAVDLEARLSVRPGEVALCRPVAQPIAADGVLALAPPAVSADRRASAPPRPPPGTKLVLLKRSLLI